MFQVVWPDKVAERTLSQLRIIQKGKEVRTMKYEKPELVAFGPACDAIQGSGKGHGTTDTSERRPSTSAYEADE